MHIFRLIFDQVNKTTKKITKIFKYKKIFIYLKKIFIID